MKLDNEAIRGALLPYFRTDTDMIREIVSDYILSIVIVSE